MSVRYLQWCKQGKWEYYESVVNAGCIFLHLSDLRLAFSSDEEQLSWLKAFETSGAITGQTEEVRLNQ